MIRLPHQARRALGALARTRLGVRSFDLVYRAQFAWGEQIPRLNDFGYRLALRQPLTREQRTASVAHAERLFFELVERLRPDVLIEAGAKDGGVSARVKAAVPEARAVAFEGNPFTYKRFRSKHGPDSSGVEYLHLALSDAEGELTFRTRVRDDGRPSADGQGSLLPRVGNHGHAEVTVPATTLDRFFADSLGKRFALWVDVEGAAGSVLAGATDVLRRADVVIVEVEERPYWDGQALRGDIVATLRAHGLVPIARDFQTRYQFNLVFVSRELRKSPDVKAGLAAARRARPLTRPGPR